MQYINLTKYAITLINNKKDVLTIPPSGIEAVRSSSLSYLVPIDGLMPVCKKNYSGLLFFTNGNLVNFENNSGNIYLVEEICLRGENTPTNFFAVTKEETDPQGNVIYAALYKL